MSGSLWAAARRFRQSTKPVTAATAATAPAPMPTYVGHFFFDPLAAADSHTAAPGGGYIARKLKHISSDVSSPPTTTLDTLIVFAWDVVVVVVVGVEYRVNAAHWSLG
eukprot:TRINITY_DN10838_c0_g1_i2.p1 TRINITY_DN10838_c0_g1~~TRINITY_DN10838_c0_g1_i2.p1  ORF type:complete len:108 (-),score=16.52 TRINITY_DN10838_c0_g1_i2:304-627(-)